MADVVLRSVARPHDIEIPYVVLGPEDGRRRILFAHSLFASGISAQEVFAPLVAGGWTVVAMDQRGHGQASLPCTIDRYAVREMGEDLLAILDDLSWHSSWFGGGSMGAATAMAATAISPERVNGLALIAPAIGRSPNPGLAGFGAIGAVLLSDGAEAGAAMWRGWLEEAGAPAEAIAHNLGLLQAIPSAAAGSLLSAVSSWSLSGAFDALSQLDAPVVVTAWTGDEVHPMSVAEDIVKTARRAHLRRLDQATAGAPLALFQAYADELARATATGCVEP